MNLRAWLQLFRAQTAPATILLILVPYLSGAEMFAVETLIIGLFALFAHWISFGHNSLMDTAMGYDLKDPSKSHHPLITGRVSLTAAHNVIHWSLCGLSVVAIIMSLRLSPNPLLATVCIFLWFVFGYSYNSGLSKESLAGFIPISICFTAMGAWGWFLSQSTLGVLGWLYLAFVFFTILFQISWSGNLKEMGMKERGNILMKMGASLRYTQKIRERTVYKFVPGKARYYGLGVKGINIGLAWVILYKNYSLFSLVMTYIFSCVALVFLWRLTVPRVYERGKELLNMSIMEIVTIYLPIPLVLGWLEGSILMVLGVLYFFLINKVLWGTEYPRV